MSRSIIAQLLPDAAVEAAATTTGLVVALADDTGTSKSDRISNDATFTVTNLADGDTAQYSRDNGVTWLAAMPTDLADNDYTILVREVDGADLPVGDPVSISFTLDTVAPTALTVTLTPDTFFSGGTTTFAQPYAITGQEANAVVEFTTDGGAHWLTALPGDLVDGLYTVGVRQTDVAGNISEVTEFSLDLNNTCDCDPELPSSSASHSGLF
jgi:Bacterial Ig-like domain